MSSLFSNISKSRRLKAQSEALEVFGTLSTMSLPTLFFKVGILILLFENWFEVPYHALALTPYSTRSIIGVHLWPSQIWFLFLGTSIAIADFFKNNFRIPAFIFNNAIPIVIVLAVYTVWSIYGFFAGNGGAIVLFREMVVSGLSFPALVYLARHIDVQDIFDPFIKWSVIISTVIAVNILANKFVYFLPGAENGLLFLSTFAYSYFIFKAIKSTLYIIPAIMAVLPTLIYLNKPLLALTLFMLGAIAIISTIITKKIKKYSISKRSLKISATIFLILVMLFSGIWYLNTILDGRIDRAFRENIIKVRVTETGSVYLGDLSGGRMIIWGNAIKLWKEKPIFGNGMGTAVPIRNETIYQIHNYYLQALMDTGLVGLSVLAICWLLWYLRVFRTIRLYTWNKEKTIYASLLTFVVAIFFYALYGLPLVYLSVAQFFWVLVALLTVMPAPVLPEPKPNADRTN
jgi:hypothetical protein